MNASPCGYCGDYHSSKCPLVRSYEYHPDGTLKRVEFFQKPEVAVHVQGGSLGAMTLAEGMMEALMEGVEEAKESDA